MTGDQVLENRAKRIKRLNTIAWILTVIVWLMVGAMRRIKFDPGVNLDFLAGFNALCNTGVSIALIVAYILIKKYRDIPNHKRSMYVAMILSAGFLVSYIGYHITHTEVAYCGTGVMRSVYYFILFSHIILAGLSLPFILLTFIRGYTGDYEVHRRMARKVYPVWLYVALTGPIVYLFLLPCR